ncbi:MAG TPA: hypothetical protein VIP78_08610 [Candidatus Dormibacteraeota bacterium]|jgi:uncharacterized membrane protein
MTAPHAIDIVEGYLARLEAELTVLPGDRRRELLADVRAHITEARARLEQETDADLLNTLDRLGEPAELARAAMDGRAEPLPVQQPADPTLAWGWIEVAAILLLILAWPAGAILVWLSRFWRTRDKVVATVLGAVPFSLGFPLFAPLIGPLLGPLVQRLGGPAPLFIGALGLLNLVAAIYLAIRLWKRGEQPWRLTGPLARG